MITDLKDIVLEGVDWIYLAQDSGRWRAIVNTVRILVSMEEGEFVIS
jgi:hypothetical protein